MDESRYREDVGATLRQTRNSALPSWVTDRTCRLVHDADRGGVAYHGKAVASKACKQGCGCNDTSTTHMYGECPRTALPLWEWVLALWARISGKKLSHKDLKVTVWGRRDHTWHTAADRLRHSSIAAEERFRVLHAATVTVLWDAWRAKEWPHHNDLRIKVHNSVLQLVSDRAALNPKKFDQAWGTPGYVSNRCVGGTRRVVINFWSHKWRLPVEDSLQPDFAEKYLQTVHACGTTLGGAGRRCGATRRRTAPAAQSSRRRATRGGLGQTGLPTTRGS
jgi:hypothetical protein